MFRSAVAVMIFFFLFSPLKAQIRGLYSVGINGALIFPDNDQRGLSASLRFSRALGKTTFLYASIGYSHWDKNKIKLQMGEDRTYYDEDDHTMVPLRLGLRFETSPNTIVYPFLEVETGMNFLWYNKHDTNVFKYPEDDRNGKLYVNYTGKVERKNELQWSIGWALGVIHPVSSSVDMRASMRMNMADIETFPKEFRLYFMYMFGVYYRI